MEGQITLAEPLHIIMQGEGALLGQKMLCIRVQGCNIQCPQCDTKYTWENINNHKFKISLDDLKEEILKYVEKYDLKFVMFTGGEPQNYRHEIFQIINSLNGLKFEIETTGKLKWQKELTSNQDIHWDLSPKIGSLEPKIVNNSHWLLFEEKPFWYNLKIPVHPLDWDEACKSIKKFQEIYKITNELIYISPIGMSRREILDQSNFLIDKCFSEKWNFSPRLHILLHDNQRLR